MNDLISRAEIEAALARLYQNLLAAAEAGDESPEFLGTVASGVSQSLDAIRALPAASQPEAEPVACPPFVFDRYINGQLMAEGVQIERGATLEKAMVAAARIASRGPNGEVPVLVLTTPAPVVPAEGLDMLADQLQAISGKRYDMGRRTLTIADADVISKAAAALRAQQPAAPVSVHPDDLAVDRNALAALIEALEDAEYDLLQWLECSAELVKAGFNMDGTADVVAKARAALDKIGEKE